MKVRPSTHVFLLGKDYHLGDLLWLTVVLAEYRRQLEPGKLLVGCPNRPISRILEHNPLIDELVYGPANDIRASLRRRYGTDLVLHDLRVVPLAGAMLRAWRRRLPWLYYRDLWLQERGQWLATFLQLGRLRNFRPVVTLVDDDRVTAASLPYPYVVLAPHVGRHSLPLAASLWQRIKGWEPARWTALADQLGRQSLEVVTLAAGGQAAIPGTRPLPGLPIRHVAGVIEQAAALVTVESGLWLLAAALDTPYIITPWWLPRSINWAEPMNVPHRLIYRDQASVGEVLSQLHELAWISHERCRSE